MGEIAESQQVFVFEMTEGQIDADEVASTFVKISRSSRNKGSSMKNRTQMILIGALFVLMPTAALASISLPVALAASIALCLVAWRIVRGEPSRLAKRLRSLPDVVGPGRFSAGPTGTVDATTSASTTLAWNRYESASTVDGFLALVQDTQSIRLVPWRSLTQDVEPAQVLSTVQAWIDAAT